MIQRLAYTLFFLRLIQLYYQVWKRVSTKFKTTIGKFPSLTIAKRGGFLLFAPLVPKIKCASGTNYFEFLNLLGCFNGSWDDESNGKLWAYNLNYMDYLLQPNMTKEEGLHWINRFIESLPTNRNGLEAYPIALRGINWIKFLSKYQIHNLHIDNSLYAQYRILERNLEFHLLGNHLLEDAFSCIICSYYFTDERMYKRSTRLLLKEIREQTLNDGGHYEQSPMYHCILLDRLLDCLNVVKNNNRFEGQDILEKQLQSYSVLWLGWLESIIYLDGSIPLLNDSAYGIAPTPQQLFEYAERLSLTWSKSTLSQSGYRKLISRYWESVVDIGNIEASYQPGHTHADTFSFELRIDGNPFIIDSGISTYNKNERRQYERETAAHSTVTVDNKSSSDVWGGFRVGKRAKVTILCDKKDRITAQHNGFNKVVHQREFFLDNSSFQVIDSLLGNKKSYKKGVSRIILHPEVTILETIENEIKTNLGTIRHFGTDSVEFTSVKVALEYNRLIRTTSICFKFSNTMNYTIQQ